LLEFAIRAARNRWKISVCYVRTYAYLRCKTLPSPFLRQCRLSISSQLKRSRAMSPTSHLVLKNGNYLGQSMRNEQVHRFLSLSIPPTMSIQASRHMLSGGVAGMSHQLTIIQRSTVINATVVAHPRLRNVRLTPCLIGQCSGISPISHGCHLRKGDRSASYTVIALVQTARLEPHADQSVSSGLPILTLALGQTRTAVTDVLHHRFAQARRFQRAARLSAPSRASTGSPCAE